LLIDVIILFTKSKSQVFNYKYEYENL
jgi:hypothetical protein